MEKTPHIAIVPSPGMGHLIPLVEFAKKLKNNHNISATFMIPNDGPLSTPQRVYLDSLPTGLNHIILPSISLNDLPQDARMETRISLMITRSIDPIRQAFKSLVAETNMVALFIDLFGTDAFDVAIEFGVSPYVFFPSTAMALSLFLHLPKLDQMVSCEYWDLPEPVQIPGCIPVHGRDLLDPIQDRKDDAYKWVLHNAKRYMMAEGIAVNSFKELEGGALKALLEDEPGKPRVYPVGPLIQSGSSSDADGSECLRWLDGQPCGSVLFISFGSGGTLSSNQLNELALGLELSEQRFIWVVRSPNDRPNATYFNLHGHEDPLGFLPKGFLEKTKDIGLVVPSWAPQAQILSHSSTGEEGKPIRSRIRDLKDAAANVLSKDGCSTKTLDQLMDSDCIKVDLENDSTKNDEVESMETQDIKDNDDNNVGAKRKQKDQSIVWNYFSKLNQPSIGGKLQCKCNKCKHVFIYDSKTGTVFYEATSSAKIEDLKDFALPNELQSLVPLVDYGVSDLHELPLVMVQFNQLSCGGISLGIGISNILADGASASHFTEEWARIAQRHTTQLSRFKHKRYEPNPPLIGRSDDLEERNKETKIVILHLNKNQVQKLEDTVKKSRPAGISCPFSRFEALAGGHIWRCGSKARGHQPTNKTKHCC
ncbi:hypothetical protein E3N88_43897 [Mikania micrantha]|uniref:Hydroquinone glucosyltransferase n=1 Tax=Mikania micrantha TaxID=192012 RepID=A0A5N6LDM6_9ASTR|nr:hypothetical protein E3N88_43897 [Mikania micrantha]